MSWFMFSFCVRMIMSLVSQKMPLIELFVGSKILGNSVVSTDPLFGNCLSIQSIFSKLEEKSGTLQLNIKTFHVSQTIQYLL